LVNDGKGDGVVDMRDVRRLRDAYLMLYEASLDLNGLMQGTTLHPKMDLNGDGTRSGVPSGAAPPPGRAELRGENIWSRFDFNGDGVLHLDRAMPFKKGSKTDLEVLADVWGNSDAAAVRKPDLEGRDSLSPQALRDLMMSADLEVRADKMFADVAHKALGQVEVHVWRADAGEEDPVAFGVPGIQARRVKRSDQRHSLVFTVPLNAKVALGDQLRASAYWVVDETKGKQGYTAAPLVPKSPQDPPVFVAKLGALKPGADRVAAFAPGEIKGERYLYIYRDPGAASAELQAVIPNDPTPPVNLLQGIAGIPDGLTCSPTGSHVVFRVGTDLYTIRALGGAEKAKLADAEAASMDYAPVLSDDGNRLVWIERQPDDTRVVVVRDPKPNGTTTKLPLGTFKALGLGIGLSPDGAMLLASDLPAPVSYGFLPAASFGAVARGHQRVVSLSDGKTSLFYLEMLSVTLQGFLEMKAQVEANGASFTSTGHVVFASDEAQLLELEKTLGGTPGNPEVALELYTSAAVPVTAPTGLTFASMTSAGKWKAMPALSPSGKLIVYYSIDADNLWRVRLLDTGSKVSTVVKQVGQGGGILGLCWLAGH
jgi:hypothetical protein